MMKKRTSLFLAMVLAMTACESPNQTTAQKQHEPQQQATTTATWEEIAPNPDWETLLVGSEINYAPFEFKDPMGKPIGFEVDLLTAVAHAEKMNVQFIHHSRNQFVDALNSGKFSIFASAFSVNPERAEKVDFTQPYMNFYRAVMILDTPENQSIQSIADFTGKKIATNKSSKVNMKLITQLSGNESNIVTADTFYLAMKDMYAGKAVGVMGDDNSLAFYDKRHADIKTRILRTNEPPTPLAFAVKKGNTELVNKLNSGLEKIKKDGTYDKIHDKWFKK